MIVIYTMIYTMWYMRWLSNGKGPDLAFMFININTGILIETLAYFLFTDTVKQLR